MNLHPPKPVEYLRRRCRMMAGLLFTLLLLITFSLWRASIDFMDIRFQQASDQNANQSIERFTTLFEERLSLLRHIGHFYENVTNVNSTAIQQIQFEAFCTSMLNDVPGIRSVLLTDTGGRPIWISPQDSLPMSLVMGITGDPKLETTLNQALKTGQTAITEGMDMPEIGTGFLAVSPIMIGNRHLGYILGVFQYQELLGYLLPADLLQHYKVSIIHAGRPVFPAVAGIRFRSRASAPEPSVSFYGKVQSKLLGGQDWTISIDPISSQDISPVNRVSLIILGLGLSLSCLLTYLAYRWQWKAIQFQVQARDSQSRLERTGLSLAEIKTELDLILNSVDEGIIFYDEQLEPVQANAAFLMIFGMNEDENAIRAGHAHHEHMIQFVGSETKYWSLFNALRNNAEHTYTDELEVRPRRGNGKSGYKVLQRRAACACRPDGTSRGILVIYKDMTKSRMIDRVKDEFLSNVTHELRSPLASIKGFAETIRRDPKMAEETRSEFITIICEEAARLQTLIDELLDLRRMDAQGATFLPTQYDIKMLVEESAKGARSIMLTKNLVARIQWDGLFGSTLKGDAGQLGRALRNLLVNAVKYSPQNGEIGITGHCGQYRIWLEVTDHGPGIHEKDLPHIFDKFYRGTRQGYQKGTGLGLAIVKNIVEMHGGHLGVRSEVGVGTTFRVDLPRNYPLLARSAAPEPKAAEIPAETPLEVLRELEEGAP